MRENGLDAEQHGEREDALLYERVTEHSELGAERTLAVLRKWFADRALRYLPTGARGLAYAEAADLIDRAREIVQQADFGVAVRVPVSEGQASGGDGT